MLQKWPKHIKWECAHYQGGPWHGILGWWPRTHWPGDPAVQPESCLPSVLFFHVLVSVVGKVPPSTATGSQTPPKVLVLNLSSSQTPMAGVTATTSTTCMDMAKLPLPPAPRETWWKSRGCFYRRRLPQPCSWLCVTHPVVSNNLPEVACAAHAAPAAAEAAKPAAAASIFPYNFTKILVFFFFFSIWKHQNGKFLAFFSPNLSACFGGQSVLVHVALPLSFALMYNIPQFI